MEIGETWCWTEVTRGYLGEEEEALGLRRGGNGGENV